MFFAVFIAMIAMNLFKPGIGVSIDAWQLNEVVTSEALSFKDFLYQFILGLFENPFASLSNGKILPLIIFSILIGIALNEKNKVFNPARDFFKSFYEIIFKIVNWIMYIAPFGIFGLLVNMVVSQNITIFSQVGIFMLIVIGVILFHGIIFLPTLLFLFNRVNILSLWKGGRVSFISAFATSSSSATLPITLKASQNNFGASKDVSNFVLPIGATMNMDGTAMYEASSSVIHRKFSRTRFRIISTVCFIFYCHDCFNRSSWNSKCGNGDDGYGASSVGTSFGSSWHINSNGSFARHVPNNSKC